MLENNQKIVFDVSYAAFVKIIGIVLLLLFLYLVRDLLLMIVVAVVIASAIDSWIDWLQKKRVPRWLSVIFVFLVLIGLFVLLFSLLVPPIIEQTQQLVGVLPQYVQLAFDQLSNFKGIVGERAYDNILSSFSSFDSGVGENSFSVFGTISGIFGGIFSVIMIFVLSFYFTVQENSLKKFIKSLMPLKHRAYIDDLVGRVQKQIGYWLRGQIVLGVVVGVMLYIGLSLMGVKYALLLAILGGLLEIVPYIGPIISAVPAVFLAFTQSPLLALLVVALYIVVQQIENHLLVPKIMQRVVGLNPLITIIVILVGIKIAGVVGGILAVPIATAAQVFMSDIFKHKDEEDKEKLKEEICKTDLKDEAELSQREKKYRQELQREVCEDDKSEA